MTLAYSYCTVQLAVGRGEQARTLPFTRYYSHARWQGQTVELDGDYPCPTDHADLAEVDDYGLPTPWLMCYDCGAFGLKPDDKRGAPIAECSPPPVQSGTSSGEV